MNLGDLTGLVEKPFAAVSDLVNTPNAAGRYRPCYLRNLLDAVQGRTLRRSSSPIGQLAAVADAVNPAAMDRLRNGAFSMFEDSSAAKGDQSDCGTTEFDDRSETFVRATRGIHW